MPEQAHRDAPGPGERPSPRLAPGAAVALFCLWLSIYVVFGDGTFHNRADEWYPYAATESLAKHGGLGMDSLLWAADTVPYPWQRFGRDGDLYPIFSPIQSAAGVPLYRLALQFPSLGLARTTLLTNGIVSALTDVLLFAILLRLGFSTGASLLTVAGYAAGTIAFVHAKGYFSEPITALCLVLAAYGLLAWRARGAGGYLALTGLGLGLAFLNRPTYALAVPIFALFILATWRRSGQGVASLVASIAAVAVPFAACLAAQGWLDWLRFGNPLDLGYADQATRFTAPFLVGLVGELVSPGKGLLIYCPVLLLSLLGARRLWARDPAFAALCLALVGVYVALYAPWHAWFGGSHAWGPRYLLPVVPFAAIPMAEVFEAVLARRRAGVLVLSSALLAWSVAIQVAGATFDYIPYVDQLFAQYRIETPKEDDQLIPVYFGLANSQPIRQFGYASPKYSDVSWLGADSRGAAIVAWAPLGVSLAAVAVCSLVLAASLRRPPLPGALAAALALAPVVAATFVAFRGYETAAAARADPYGQLYRLLTREARPGDGLVTVSVDATAGGFSSDASPTLHDGFVRQDSLPMSPTVRRFLERADASESRIWMIAENGQDRIENWLAAGADQRVVASAGTLRLLLFTPGGAAETRRQATLGPGWSLEGFSAPALAAAGTRLDVSLWLRSAAPGGRDLTVFVHVLDASGRLVAQHDAPPRAGMAPTSTWQPGEVVRDRHVVALPSSLAPGRYTLTAGLYDAETGARVPATSGDRRWPNDEVELGPLEVSGAPAG